MKKNIQLTKEIVAPAKMQDIIRIASITLVVLLLINAVLIPLSRLPHGYGLVQKKYELLRNHEWDVLILGDSSCLHGMDPSAFSEKMGKKAVNLGTQANMTIVNDFIMLKEYLERGAIPEMVVMCHSYDVISRKMGPIPFNTVPLTISGLKKALPGYPAKRVNWTKVALTALVPLYFQSSTVAYVVRHLPQYLFGEPMLIQPDGLSPIVEADPLALEKDFEKAKAKLDKNKGVLKVTAENEYALQRIGELADKYNVPVYFVVAPLYEGLTDNELFNGLFSEYVSTIQTLSSSYSNFHFIKNDLQFVPAESCDFVDHVDHDTAKKFSEVVAERIKSERADQSKQKLISQR